MEHDPRRSLGRLISILDRHADRFARGRLARHGIGKAHLQFLGSLYIDGDGISQEELAQRLYMDKSAVARSLDRLESLCFIERAEDSADARRKRVELTAKARRLWPEIVSGLETWNGILTRGFRVAEQRTVVDLLSRMVDNAVAYTRGEITGSPGSSARRGR